MKDYVDVKSVNGVKVMRLKMEYILGSLPGLTSLSYDVSQIANMWNSALVELADLKALNSITAERCEDFILFERAMHRVFIDTSQQMNLKTIRYIWSERPTNEDNIKYGGATEKIAFAWKGCNALFIYDSKDVHNAKGMRKTLLASFD